MKILSYLVLLLIVAIQVPAWFWATIRGRDYQWWGGPQ